MYVPKLFASFDPSLLNGLSVVSQKIDMKYFSNAGTGD